MTAPERIWAYPSNITGWDMGFNAVARSVRDAIPYILAAPEALAASPEVQAMIREAEARGMERAANMIALAPLSYLPHSPGAVAFFADPTATLNNVAKAIHAEAAAIRGESK